MVAVTGLFGKPSLTVSVRQILHLQKTHTRRSQKHIPTHTNDLEKE